MSIFFLDTIYDCYPESGHLDTPGKPFTQVFDPVVEDTFGPILGGSGSGSGGSGSSESDNTNDDEGHLEDFWDFDFSDDGTEDECTVPYDCGDGENDEGNNDEGSGLPDEENSSEGNNG